MAKLEIQRDRQFMSSSIISGHRCQKSGYVTDRMLRCLRSKFAQQGWEVEHLNAIFFDSAKLYIDDRQIGSGHLDKLVMRMRPLFRVALDLHASGLILAHNHPSGDCRPSSSDLSATRRLADMAKALDIELFDHLILTQDDAYSMRSGARL